MKDWKIDEWLGKQVFTLATKANVRAMTKAALIVEADVKTHFTKMGQGRVYGRHTASKPGDPPAIDTGLLRASTATDVRVILGMVTGKVGILDGVKYALPLELGTIKMSPRPYLRPALKRNHKKIEAIFKEANG